MGQRIILNSSIPFIIAATILVLIAILRLVVLFLNLRSADKKTSKNFTMLRSILRWSSITWALIITLVSTFRPTLVHQHLPTSTQKPDSSNMNIYFVVDSSPSMKVKDNGQNLLRSELARKDMLDIFAYFPLARYSLITYGDSARIDWPLSADNWSFSQRIRSYDAYDSSTPSAAKAADPWDSAEYIRSQIDLSVKQNPLMDNFVFFFSTGDPLSAYSNDAKAPTKFSEIPSIAGGYVFGYGTYDGGPIAAFRVSGGTVYVEDNNHTFIVGINEKTLKTISSAMGVDYIHRNEKTSVTTLLDTLLSHPITRQLIFPNAKAPTVQSELYWILTILAVILLLPEFYLLIRTSPWISSLMTKVHKNDS